MGSSPLSLLLSLSVSRQLCSITPFCYDFLSHHRPKSNGSEWPCTDPVETKSQNKLFSFKLFFFFQVFCHSNEKLTNIAFLIMRPNMYLVQELEKLKENPWEISPYQHVWTTSCLAWSIDWKVRCLLLHFHTPNLSQKSFWWLWEHTGRRILRNVMQPSWVEYFTKPPQ